MLHLTRNSSQPPHEINALLFVTLMMAQLRHPPVEETEVRRQDPQMVCATALAERHEPLGESVSVLQFGQDLATGS